MRRALTIATFAALSAAGSAQAYEYTLQFTPNAGARNLVVAGYAFQGADVVGNCSYETVTGGGSGRGGGYHSHTTYYNQTCTWDGYGNLLSVVQGAPTPPTPISSANGITIYAQNAAGDTTGVDTTRGNIGFVNTPSAHYSWVTQPTVLSTSNTTPLSIVLTLTSDGDLPLTVGKIQASANLAKAWVQSSTCRKPKIKPGATCTITVTYNPHAIPPGDDPYTAYDALTVTVVANTAQSPDFTELIEVAVAPGG